MYYYHIKTFGCQMNFSDSERLQTLLEEHGYTELEDMYQADLVIFNTCGVRQTAENRVYGWVHNLRKKDQKQKIVITGCLAKREDVKKKLKEKVDLFIPINDIQDIFKKLELQDQTEYCEHYLKIKAKHKNKNSILVPIMTGCNNFCSYCVVPYARDREWSRPIEDIIAEIEIANKNELKEVMLLGQNVNSYIFKEKNQTIKFPQLLNTLAKKFPKIFFKFLSSHPKDFSDELINIIAENKNISREIHLPLQAGSDKILKAMNRPYTQEYYLNLVKKIKSAIPDANITTDVIIGFPGENEKDFEETINVFKEVGYTEAYTNKYSPRPGTAAYKLGDPIDWSEKKNREKTLRKLIKRQTTQL